MDLQGIKGYCACI